MEPGRVPSRCSEEKSPEGMLDRALLLAPGQKEKREGKAT